MDFGLLKGELVWFTATDGVELAGFLSRPPRAKGIVIHVHGLTGNFYGYRARIVGGLASELNRRGIALLSIATRGSYVVSRVWKTARVRRKMLYAGGGLERFEECVRDIEGAIRFARRLGFRKVWLSGHSTGCQKIVYYQARKRNRLVRGLVLLAPGDDLNVWRKELGRKFGATVALARKIARNTPGALMPFGMVNGYVCSARRFLSLTDARSVEGNIFNYELPRLRVLARVRVPVLVVWGSEEEFALRPLREYDELIAKSVRAPLSVAIVKGANHGFRWKERELAGVVSRWLTA
ncbi:DUF1749 domain-containing protein [Candidatus Micrarchaeota archaeon]|nr:DUF1749 domain-containing protein [Candidatus Micrarchaeota archaeon]